MVDMSRSDYSQLPEILDEIEDMLDAQESLQGLLQTHEGADGVWKVLMDSRISH